MKYLYLDHLFRYFFGKLSYLDTSILNKSAKEEMINTDADSSFIIVVFNYKIALFIKPLRRTLELLKSIIKRAFFLLHRSLVMRDYINFAWKDAAHPLFGDPPAKTIMTKQGSRSYEVGCTLRLSIG